MASTTVNSQITDAVTQTNVTNLAASGANALSNLYQVVSNSMTHAIQNAAFGQQQTNTIHQATTTQGVNLIYAVDTEAVADGATKIARADVPDTAINNILLSSLIG